MRKLITLILIVLLAGCARVESGPGTSFEDVDIDAIYESFQRSFSYVHYNFYYSTPHQDLDPDYERCDENYACKYGKQWVISTEAMIREYGQPKTRG